MPERYRFQHHIATTTPTPGRTLHDRTYQRPPNISALKSGSCHRGHRSAIPDASQPSRHQPYTSTPLHYTPPHPHGASILATPHHTKGATHRTMARNTHSTSHVRRGRHSVNPPTQLPCRACGRNVPPRQQARNLKAGLSPNLCSDHSTPTPTPCDAPKERTPALKRTITRWAVCAVMPMYAYGRWSTGYLTLEAALQDLDWEICMRERDGRVMPTYTVVGYDASAI